MGRLARDELAHVRTGLFPAMGGANEDELKGSGELKRLDLLHARAMGDAGDWGR